MLEGRSIEFSVHVHAYDPAGQPVASRRGKGHHDPLAAAGAGAAEWRHVYVRYKAFSDDKHSWGAHGAAEDRRHAVGLVDAAFLQHIQHACIIFELWGQPADDPAAAACRAPPPLPPPCPAWAGGVGAGAVTGADF
eukprot:gene35657-18598_t